MLDCMFSMILIAIWTVISIMMKSGPSRQLSNEGQRDDIYLRSTYCPSKDFYLKSVYRESQLPTTETSQFA